MPECRLRWRVNLWVWVSVADGEPERLCWAPIRMKMMWRQEARNADAALLYVWHRHAYPPVISFIHSASCILRGISLKPRTSMTTSCPFIFGFFMRSLKNSNSCLAPTSQLGAYQRHIFVRSIMFEHLTDEQLVIKLNCSSQSRTSHDLIIFWAPPLFVVCLCGKLIKHSTLRMESQWERAIQRQLSWLQSSIMCLSRITYLFKNGFWASKQPTYPNQAHSWVLRKPYIIFRPWYTGVSGRTDADAV